METNNFKRDWNKYIYISEISKLFDIIILVRNLPLFGVQSFFSSFTMHKQSNTNEKKG